MSEMIERVAKALAVADGMHPEATSNDEDETPIWELYVISARSAIEAMRIPTEAMETALARSAWQSGSGRKPAQVISDVIDAALSEDKP